MTFWDHIDELRKSLVYPLILLFIATAVTFVFKDPVFDMILAANSADFVTYSLGPADGLGNASSQLVNLISTELPAQFLMHMKVSFCIGLILTIPFLLFKLFRYAAPGLYTREKRYSARVLVFSFISFFTGIIINYFVIFPFSLRFLASYSVSGQVDNLITLSSYINTLMSMSLLMGLFFELPVMSWLLSKLGILKAATLRRYRRHSIVGILVVSAVITPTTDIFTLLLVAVPIVLLYELSILIAQVSQRQLPAESQVALAD